MYDIMSKGAKKHTYSYIKPLRFFIYIPAFLYKIVWFSARVGFDQVNYRLVFG